MQRIVVDWEAVIGRGWLWVSGNRGGGVSEDGRGSKWWKDKKEEKG